MKRKITIGILLAMLTGITIDAIAQNPRPSKKATELDFGIMLGGSNYLGELTQSSIPAMNETNLAGGIIVRYTPSSAISLKAAALYMRLTGDDKNFDSDEFRRRRNLNFRSDVWEFSGHVEWNILGWTQTRTSFPATPYLFAGIGVFRFNPMTQFFYNENIHDPSLSVQNEKWIELQPLSTEAQETTKNNQQKRYPLTQLSIPLGVGYKIQLSDQWTIGAEFGVRKTFTDYIDDISTIYWDNQIVGGAGGYMAVALKDRAPELGLEPFLENTPRGNDNTKDWYMFGGIQVTYRIIGGKVNCFNFE